MACAGPIPISSGGTPTTTEPANFPMGERPSAVAVERRQRRVADAPSEIWELFPAVVVPVSLNTGFSFAIEAVVALWRIPSSRDTGTVSSEG